MEFVFEVILEIFGAIYLEIMTAFLPKTKLKKYQRKVIAGAEAIVLLILLIVGAVMIAETDFNTLAGKILVVVSGSIIVLQSSFGIIVKSKKNKSE